MNWIIIIGSITLVLLNLDVCTCTAGWQNKNQQNDDTNVIPEHIIRRDFIDEIIESTDYLFVNKTKNERESLLRLNSNIPDADISLVQPFIQSDDNISIQPQKQPPQNDKRLKRRKKGHKKKHKRIKVGNHNQTEPFTVDNNNLEISNFTKQSENSFMIAQPPLTIASISHQPTKKSTQNQNDNDDNNTSNLILTSENNKKKNYNLNINNNNSKSRNTRRRRKKKLNKNVEQIKTENQDVITEEEIIINNMEMDVMKRKEENLKHRAAQRQQRLLEREQRKLDRERFKEARQRSKMMRRRKNKLATTNTTISNTDQNINLDLSSSAVTHELDNSKSPNLAGKMLLMTDYKSKVILIGDLSCMKGRFQQAPAVLNADIKYLRNDINGIENAFMEAEYHCRDGYQLIFNSNNLNNTNLICSEKQWIGEKPSCEKKSITTKNICKHSNRCDQICLIRNSTEKCTCYKGFRWTGNQCIDINECMENEKICEFGCSNTVGSYRCKCPRGLRTSESNACVDINECLLRNGHGPCQDTCINLMGSYKCTCDSLPGTKLSDDNHSCEDVDECSLNNGGCSHTCLNTLGRAFCVCPEGWMLDEDWKTCIDIDECSLEYQKSLKLEKRCDYGCINTMGSYRCIIEIGGADEAIIDDVPACPNGFYFNVTIDDCQDIDECEYENGGCSDQCVNTDGSFVCTCRPGYVFGDDKRICIVSNQTSDIACPPLFPPRHGYLECSRPLETIDGRNRITNRPGSQCILRCPTGFRVVGIFSKVCGTTGQWIGNGDGSCIRYPTPKLVCPKDIRVEIPPYETAVNLRIPRPKTDVDFGKDVIVEPLWAKESELKMKTGTKNITYTAKHPLSKLTISCTFSINVLEGQPPIVEYCPDTQKYTLVKSHESIKLSWLEPKFSDNINVTDVTRTNIPGNYFGLGSHQIVYEAKDVAGYRNRCVFKIIVNAPKHNGYSSLQLPILYNKFYK